ERSELGAMITPGYAPIEQYASAVPQGPWTDIYALGATLYWLLTGHKPPEAPERLGDPDPLPSAESMCKGRYSAQFLRALASMLITAYYNLAETQERLAATEVRNLEDLAQATAGRISQVLAASRSLADYVGTDDDFVDYLSRPTPAATGAILAKLDGLVK